MIRSFPPHPNPLPPRGEGRPFILPAELGGILAYFYKKHRKKADQLLDQPALRRQGDERFTSLPFVLIGTIWNSYTMNNVF
jgi:hypothetical protein